MVDPEKISGTPSTQKVFRALFENCCSREIFAHVEHTGMTTTELFTIASKRINEQHTLKTKAHQDTVLPSMNERGGR